MDHINSAGMDGNNGKTVAVNHPISINIGSRYRLDRRNVRLDRIHDNETVELIDTDTLGTLLVRTPGVEGLSPPTLGYLRDAYKDGRLIPLDEPDTPAGRHGRNILLDPDACVDADRKSMWRHVLARRALDDEIPRTDAACGEWLNDEYGKEPGDLEFKKPSPSALRRWMTKLIKNPCRSVLVSNAGRRKGQSQLDPLVDRLVHEAALWYWTRRNGRIADAYSLLDQWIKDENEKAVRKPGWLPLVRPHLETLRKRIARLRCYDTVKAKLGERAARKML